MRDPYFERPEVSNSDLSWLEGYWDDDEKSDNKIKAYRFGTLLDAMVTEQHRINYYKLTCDNEIYTAKEFELSKEMKKAFWKDPFCKMLAENSELQSVVVNPKFKITHQEFIFWMAVRLKFDFDARKRLKMTGDLKSTTATTYKQFLAACEYFGYWRQRAWYMDIGGSDKDMLIGVSKVNMEVFKVPIERGGDYYNIGKRQYEKLAFDWHTLFGDWSDTLVLDLSTVSKQLYQSLISER